VETLTRYGDYCPRRGKTTRVETRAGELIERARGEKQQDATKYDHCHS
jgi:hypothetical protein